jgi:arsenical pump membrane protein
VTSLTWGIAFASIALMLVRPWQIAEYVWVLGGALLLLCVGGVSVTEAIHAIGEGHDVYLFLIGMMLLAELAKREGVFTWIADIAVVNARGSSARLFLGVYLVGVFVTTFLSNDATAIVLTPAVAAAVRRARVKDPLPYLLACALIANAASFVLPISNPANLVLYARGLPPLGEWLATYALPSLAAIAVTYGCLIFLFRRTLAEPIPTAEEPHALPKLSAAGRATFAGLFVAVVALSVASALAWPLGICTFALALGLLALVSLLTRGSPVTLVKHVSWSVLPLVAGLFIIVEALNRAGALDVARGAFRWIATWPEAELKILAAFGVGLISNVVNNLPVGLAGGLALQQPNLPPSLQHAVLIGVDLGPNLSVTGSLATVLWLLVLRREGVRISGWSFFKVGLVAMPLALLAAVLLLP